MFIPRKLIGTYSMPMVIQTNIQKYCTREQKLHFTCNYWLISFIPPHIWSVRRNRKWEKVPFLTVFKWISFMIYSSCSQFVLRTETGFNSWRLHEMFSTRMITCKEQFVGILLWSYTSLLPELNGVMDSMLEPVFMRWWRHEHRFEQFKWISECNEQQTVLFKSNE